MSPPAPPSPSSAPAPAPALRLTLAATIAIQAASAALVAAPTVAAPLLLPALGGGPALIGEYMGLVFAAAALASQWGAALTRRLGPVRCTQAALLLSALGLPLVAVPHGMVAAAGALLVGLGLGPITPASSQMLASVAPAGRLGLVFSLRQTGMPLGGVLVGLALPALLLSAGLAAAFLLLVAVAVVAAVALQPLARHFDAARDAAAPWPRGADVVAPLLLTWAQPRLRELALCGFVFSVVQCALTNYVVTWLNRELAWTLVAAGAALALVQVAAAVGRVAWGWSADRWRGGTRGALVRLATVMALCAAALPWLGTDTPAPLVLAWLLPFGASAIGWAGVALAAVAGIAPAGRTAQATAGSLFLAYFGVVLGGPLFGLVAEALGSLGRAYAALLLPLALLWWRLRRG